MSFYHEPPVGEYGEAKASILKMLWNGEWILGDDILSTVKQAYYDRRIRELRDEDGWDIETGWLENSKGVRRPAYRLKSHLRGAGIKRPHITAEERRIVLTRDKFKCQVCGADLRSGKNNPQIDHKVPLIREGQNSVANYQAICSNCNVIKRGVCRLCTLSSCDRCYLAYPEKGARNLLVNLTEQESKHLTKIAQMLDVSRIEALRRIVKQSLEK